MLAYHWPAMSAPGIPIDALAALPVAGLKDSTGDPARLLEELDAFSGGLYTGSAALLTMAGSIGAAGAILGLANAEPELCAAAFAGDADAQRRLTPPIVAARRAFPRGLKAMVAAKYGTPETVRS